MKMTSRVKDPTPSGLCPTESDLKRHYLTTGPGVVSRRSLVVRDHIRT